MAEAAQRASGSLAGRVIAVTADRRWQEQMELFGKRGAKVLHAPTMQTVDLAGRPALREATERLVASPPKWLVVTTGSGFRLWLDTADAWGLREALVASLARSGTSIVCRGAKGASAVRGAGLDVAWRAEHESMEDVLTFDEANVPAGSSVAIQLFDPDEHWSTSRLCERHPGLVELPVYRWRLPDDVGPAEALVRSIAAGGVDAVTFTSQPAVRFLFAIARAAGLERALRDALDSHVLAVCVGPVCAEALVECGVERMVWPDPPRLVAMVKVAEAHLAR